MTHHTSLSFFGAAGTVTGSKYLIEHKNEHVLLDAGLFQGLKALRLRNWEAPPFDPKRLTSVVLSHAHLDHSGYLPLLSRNRFRGKVHCTHATSALLDIMLKDSAKIQEEDARFANKRGYSKHKPAAPLYTGEDVRKTLTLVKSHPYHKSFSASHEIAGTFFGAGHILGSAIVELLIGKKDPVKLVFSGDLGRWNQPIIKDPEYIQDADILLIESTYGDRIHPLNMLEELTRVINETVQKSGVLIIPAFAVGRTQDLIWHIRQLETENKIPVLPVFVDSPMAVDVTEVYCQHSEEHDLEMEQLKTDPNCMLKTHNFKLVDDFRESKALNGKKGPMIIIASSGMVTGGRVLHHLAHRLDDEKNTVLLAGFQAAGTRGRTLKEGAKTLRFFGQEVSVKAKVESLDGLSAHADKNDILKWLRGFLNPPKHTYIVHGEAASSSALAETIRRELGWTVSVAEDGQTVDIGKSQA